MPKAKVHDLKEKSPKPYPLIEIMGSLDIGKTTVARLVARRLEATYVAFPVLDPYTLTGRALLASLTKTPKGLESNGLWWAHIYAANLIEQQDRITEALKTGPVVVVNYLWAFRIWMGILGIRVNEFTFTLPSPDIGYVLFGPEPIPTDRPKFDFSIDFTTKLSRSMSHPKNQKTIKVLLSEFAHTSTHIYVNNISAAITASVDRRFKCGVNEFEVYTSKDFLKKKDR